MKIREKGFTLLEILISLVLLSIGYQAFITLVYWGKSHFKQIDAYSKVMSVGLLKMEETNAKAYSNLTSSSSGIFNGIYWNINISNMSWGIIPPRIPYKLIVVTAADKLSSNPKRIETRLENIVPYPRMHSISKTIKDLGTTLIENRPGVPFLVNRPAGTWPTPLPTMVIGSPSVDYLELDINYEVRKNIEIIYNVSIHQVDILSPFIEVGSTIVTQCFIDNVAQHVQARTPFCTQPLVSNHLTVLDVDPGRHNIEVRWYKEVDAGTLTLRDAELTVLAYEPP